MQCGIRTFVRTEERILRDVPYASDSTWSVYLTESAIDSPLRAIEHLAL